MPDFRQDPISGDWVTIAPERAKRPVDFDDSFHPHTSESCPFCEGNEHQTPHEVLALRPHGGITDGPGWSVRVVENKYPFVTADDVGNPARELMGLGLTHRPAVGVHQVIIESPRHVTRLSELEAGEMRDVLYVYRQRLRELRASQRWPYALVFKNNGAAAGASLSHIHSQLVALPMVPERIVRTLNTASEFFQRRGKSIWCDFIERECEAQQRIVARTERFVALCPFASRQPYEVLVAPLSQAAHFSELADDALPELAALLQLLIKRLEILLPSLAFNWMLNTCPFDTNSEQYYHWHVEIVPRVTAAAGYEWATGYAVNAVPPEDAASWLRVEK